MALRAVELCAELLSPAPTAESVARVLRAHGETDAVTARDVTALREAAVRLAEVLAAPSPGQAAELLNRILAGSAGPPRLTSHGGVSGWHLHVDSSDEAPWAEWFLTSSALAFATLL
ncbi:MAG: CGNR zinc finger domain-containing protein, partial [Nonomuraea sp.]|nr:CGNR zinc finger domain-containing protein [Nonomuraea sp.]